MKLLKALCVSLALLAIVLTASAGDDKSSSQHWYQVVVAQPGYYYLYIGTSSLAESDLVATLSKEDGCVMLDNLLYRDNVGKYKGWHEWDPTAQSRIYLRAKAIISFQPLAGDPRKSSDTGSK